MIMRIEIQYENNETLTGSTLTGNTIYYNCDVDDDDDDEI